MEQLLEAAPPTTAYNRTALLLLYQSILDGSGRASGYFQPPVSAPNAEFMAEVQEGSQGAKPVMTVPAAAQVIVLVRVWALCGALAAYPANMRRHRLYKWSPQICQPCRRACD